MNAIIWNRGCYRSTWGAWLLQSEESSQGASQRRWPMSWVRIEGWVRIGKSRKIIQEEGTNNICREDFPGGAVVKNLPANAGDTGSIPGLERSHIPRSSKTHVPPLLSLCSRACKPQLLKSVCLEPVLRNKEATTLRSPSTTTKSSPCLLQLEKARMQQQRPNTAKNK